MRGNHDLSTAENLVDELEQAFDSIAAVVVELTAGRVHGHSAILKALLHARERALSRQHGSFALVAPLGSFSSRVLALVGTVIRPIRP